MDARLSTAGRSNRCRYRCIAALLGATLAIAVLAPIAAAESPSPADAFVESIGVNTHTYYTDTAYSNFEAVKARLAELGVHHIRENLVTNLPYQYQRLNELAAMGVHSTLIMGEPGESGEGPEEYASTLKTNLLGTVDAVEGPNEFESRGGPDWAAELRDYQQRLYAAIKGDPSLAALPVIGPSILHRSSQEAVGDISGAVDYGNIHSYPDGEAPETNLNSQLDRAALNSGPKPIVATETGYHTALNWTGEHRPVSEEAMATYMPRLFLEYFGRGVPRTFSYELIDEKPDPANAERESNFGLLRNDLSPKPAFTALRNMIAILADPGPAVSPEPLEYSLGGSQAGLHHVLLQKRDGSFYLALWRATSVWDASAKTALAPPSEPVTVSFDLRLKSARGYLPNLSADGAPIAHHGDQPIELSVGPQVLLVRLTMRPPSPERIRVWLATHSAPAGARVALHGQLPSQAAGRSLAVKIQQWDRRGWRTVTRSRTSKSGAFRKKIRVPARIGTRASRLRVVARAAKPSKAVRLRIRS